MTPRSHNNRKLRALLLSHLSTCKLCGKPPTPCVAGRVLFNLVGRTDGVPSPEYDESRIRTDRLIDSDLIGEPKIMRFRKRKFGYTGFKPLKITGGSVSCESVEDKFKY